MRESMIWKIKKRKTEKLKKIKIFNINEENKDRWLTGFLALLLVGLYLAPILTAIFPMIGGIVKPILILALLLSPFAFLSPSWRLNAFALFAVLTLSFSLIDLVYPVEWLKITALVLISIFLSFLILLVLEQVMRVGEISQHRLKGAIAGYLLIGILFQQLFVLIEVLNPGAFFLPAIINFEELESFLSDFSFVTLTTVGYGNIYPISQVARTLSSLESVIGQIYLTIFIAQLLSKKGTKA